MPSRELILLTRNGRRLTIEALAESVDMHADLIERFVAFGLVEPIQEGTMIYFDDSAVRKLRTIRRLRDDLGINLPGIAAILDLLDRINCLQRELANFRRG